MDPFHKNPELLAAFRDGDKQALAEVYRAFEQPLRNFILRGFAFKSEGRQLFFGGVYDSNDLEDILQETFRRAFGVRARAAYDGVRPYKNYLFTIARNAVITDMTVRSRQIPVGEALMRDVPGDELSPLESWVVAQRAVHQDDQDFSSQEHVENLEIYGLLMGFMECLSDEERRFFRLRFLGQCSQENTAQRMGWNRARVRKLESRLRAAFLCHSTGSGYLESRHETRKVRRISNPEHHAAFVARSRAIWRQRRVEEDNEFLVEAA
ncbi:MAG: RNA polymerase sigma factor [Myxococcota bacterium]